MATVSQLEMRGHKILGAADQRPPGGQGAEDERNTDCWVWPRLYRVQSGHGSLDMAESEGHEGSL